MSKQKKPKLTDIQKDLLNQIEDELTKQLLTFVCLGESNNLTATACTNLLKAYIERKI